MVGNSLSTTVTLNPQVWPLPLESVALHTTKVVPFWKVEPPGGVQLPITPGQLSLIIGKNITTAAHWPGSVILTILAGQEIVGGCMSMTLTVKLQEDPAVLVQLIIVGPTGKNVPEGGVHVTMPHEPLVDGAG